MTLKIGGVQPETPKQKEVTPSGDSLATIIAAVHKEKGSDQIIMAGNSVPDVERTPTGVFEFDLATGGGFPNGRYSMVYGVESSGKSNLILKAISWTQKHAPPECNKCVYVDLEGTFDPSWAEQMGVDTAALSVVKPAYGEECVDIVDALLRASDLAFLAVDSIAVMVSSKEIAKSTEGADVGTASLLMRRLCNKIVVALSQEGRKGHRPCVVLINQRRFKIGVMFGDPETIPGGETVKFLSSLTVRLYGKNVMKKEVHPDLPAFKHTNAIIKKCKIPVNAVEFEYEMAMVPADDLAVGETDSWSVVSGHLKATGELSKDKEGWSVFGKTYPKLELVREQYVCDDEFRMRCQTAVVKSVAGKKMLVQGES